MLLATCLSQISGKSPAAMNLLVDPSRGLLFFDLCLPLAFLANEHHMIRYENCTRICAKQQNKYKLYIYTTSSPPFFNQPTHSHGSLVERLVPVPTPPVVHCCCCSRCWRCWAASAAAADPNASHRAARRPAPSC